MARPNEVTVFSNGIADFRRWFRIARDQDCSISLNVRREHVGDVLASLCVFGQVRIPAPPSFATTNAQDGHLTLEASDVLEDLAAQLVGTQVEVERAVGTTRGTLVGLHQEPQATGGEPVQVASLVVLTEHGLSRLPLRDVVHLRFEDEAIQTEIEKALARSLNEIKPDSTQIQLTLEAGNLDAGEEEEVEAVVQYTVPAAAWKISYRLRDDDRGGIHLQGFAIVDNNTEEDWNDFLVSVVTGEPITFATDLAEAKTPLRKHVNVVRDEALGAVEAEAAMMEEPDAIRAIPRGVDDDLTSVMMSERLDRVRSFDSALAEEPAQWQTAQAQEVGDYSLYRSSEPLSIGAHRSIIFPVFDLALDDCRFVLYYKRQDHAERPYRAARLRYAGEQSLGRGVCTVFQEDVYAGSCIFPATRPGEEQLLPYALETGVRVWCDEAPVQRTLARIRFSEGHCYTSTRWRRRTTYHLTSSRDEPRSVVLDHTLTAGDSKVECRLRDGDGTGWTPFDADAVQTLKSGRRLECELGPRALLLIELTETRVEESVVELTSTLNTRWLQRHVVATNGPLSNDPDVLRCLQLQRRMDHQNRLVERVERQVAQLEQRQERLRKNIQVGGQDEQTGKWRRELALAEEEITELQQQRIPTLQTELDDLREELREALGSLSASWQEA